MAKPPKAGTVEMVRNAKEPRGKSTLFHRYFYSHKSEWAVWLLARRSGDFCRHQERRQEMIAATAEPMKSAG
jgi:hypothetical protein